jgi:general secretion pathway protein F
VAVWTYRALTAGGRAETGVVDAETARAAWQSLRARGVYPTDLAEDAALPGRTRRVRPPEVAAATRELATLVAAGVPLADALAGVAEHVDQPTLARALTLARARLREGASLADALGASPAVFPPLYRDLVRAGEESGALAGVLTRLAAHTEAEAATRARVRAALAYPAVMTIATTAVLGFVLAWVVPQTTALFAATGKPPPFATRALAALGTWIAEGWWLALAACGGAALALRRWLATEAARRRVDAALLRVPGVRRLVRAGAAGRLARTLATLLAGGVPLEAALGIAGPITGNRLVTDAVAAATALVEPALILAMGGVVLLLVTAVLLPLFELGSLAG